MSNLSGSFLKDVKGAETAKEVAQAAGLDFEVGESQLAYRWNSTDGGDTPGPVRVSKRQKILYRRDTGAELAIVGKDYEPHQVHEILSFMDQIKAEVPGFEFATAASLNGGRQFMLQADLGSSSPVPGDVHRKILNIHSGFGGTATKGFPGDLRLSCTNQIRMTLKGAKRLGFKVNHTTWSKERLRTLIKLIVAIGFVYQKDDEFNRELSRRQAPPDVVRKFFEAIHPDPEEGNPAKKKADRELMEQLLRSGKGSDIPVSTGFRVRDTLYGVRNAVSEFANHHRTARENGGRTSAERRFESSLFGASQKLIESADRILVAILEKNAVPEIEAMAPETSDAVDFMSNLR